MSTGENFLTQLKAVVDPMTVFSHYLSLKKSGNRYRALCPFHTEKTPSFYASDNGMFHCFGCGAGGDVVAFVMQMEKVDFRECVQLLSARYGVPLKLMSGGERKEKEILLDLMRQAADFFHNLLTGTAAGKDALDYLKERGISAETIKRFYLGWSPAGWSGLLDHFTKRDVNPELLEKCGLVVARQREGYYDRYRSRIIVPIHDIHGNIIAFGGRIFPPSAEEAKYLNSPESPIYIKSQHLFGLYFSKEHIQAKQSALLVEGYFDMIQPFQSGHSNIVASLGTSLTENQAHLLRRYTDRVTIFYDPDNAGQLAAMRAIPILLRENFTIHVATLPEGMDPDQFIRQRGAEAFEQEIETAVRYDELFLRKLSERHDLKSPSGRLAASDELMELLANMQNPFERDRAMNRFASALGVSTQLLQEMFGRKRKAETRNPRKEASRGEPAGAERRLLQVLLMSPTIALQIFPAFSQEDLSELPSARIFQQLHEIASANDGAGPAEIIHHFPAETQSLLTSLVMDREAPLPSMESALHWLSLIRQGRKDRILKQLNLEIELAQKEENPDKLNQLLVQKQELGRQAKIRNS